MTGRANTKYFYAAGVRTAEKRTGYADQNGVSWMLIDLILRSKIQAAPQ